MEVPPTEIPAEYLPLASLADVIRKNDAVNLGWTEVFSRPLDLGPLLDHFGDTVGGEAQDWEAMFLRVLVGGGALQPHQTNLS